MTGDLLPLPVPPLGYVSHAPYIVAMEFGHIDQVVTAECPTLTAALLMFVDPVIPFSQSASPVRRVLIDGRGCVVLGFVEHICECPYVVTREVIELIRELHLDEGLEEFTLLDWELTMMSRQGS